MEKMHLKVPTEGILSLVMLARRLLSTECRRALLIRRINFDCRKMRLKMPKEGILSLVMLARRLLFTECRRAL